VLGASVIPSATFASRTERAVRTRIARLPLAIALSAVAAATLGLALQVNFGQIAPGALLPLGASLLASVLAVAVGRAGLGSAAGLGVTLLSVALSFYLLLAHPPCATWPAGAERELSAFRLIVVGAAAATVGAFVAGGRTSAAAGWLLVIAYVAAGLVVLRTVPQPGVDVCTFQREAADALLTGRNPYVITFADPYGPGRGFYGDGLTRDGRTTFGYPYPPLPLLLSLPGHLLGDFRLSMLAATALAGLLLLHARPRSALGVPAVAMLLFTPRGFFVLEAGWIEPVVILALAFTIFVTCRLGPVTSRAQTARHRLAPEAGDAPGAKRAGVTGQSSGSFWVAVAAGLLLATKQYMVLALPLLMLLPLCGGARARWKMLAMSLAIAALMTLPPALPDWQAFVRSVVTLQFHQPFRPDALSFLVPIAAATGQTPPTWIAFAAAGGVVALCLWRAPRTPSGFALSVAAVFFAFFAFNKQAFCNYYHFVVAALCCALAAQKQDGPVPVREPALRS
jgi:hypothetical protein